MKLMLTVNCFVLVALLVSTSPGQAISGTFDGKVYAFYDVSGSRSISTTKDTVSCRIKTFSTDGTILIANGTDNYLILELRFGYVQARLRFRNMNGPEFIINNGVGVSNNRWHAVVFTRDRHSGILSVDNIKSPHDRRTGLGGLDNLIFNSMIYVGGTPAGDSISSGNFTGCIENPVFNSDNILQKAINSGQSVYGLVGSVPSQCTDTTSSRAVTLGSTTASIVRINWQPTGGVVYNFEFWFRTVDDSNNVGVFTVAASNTAIAYMNQGIITLSILGTAISHIFVSPVNDGSWHLLSFRASAESFRVYIDGIFGSVSFENSVSGQETVKVTIGFSFLSGFVGCIRGITMDGAALDITAQNFQLSGVSNACTVQNLCKPFFPCYHNGTCSNAGNTFACDCGQDSDYEGTYCQTYKYKRSCQEVFILNPEARTGWYMIDPDGPLGPIRPFTSQCLSDSHTTTQVSNDRESYTTIPRSNIGPGSYKVDIVYRAVQPNNPITTISIAQAAALADASQSCSQRIAYRCLQSVLLNSPNEPYGWWVSRDNMQIVSWGGAPIDSKKCDCGVTESCINSSKMCNCDSNQYTLLEDIGTISDKRYLPVKNLRFGFARRSNNTIGQYSLGKLVCRNRADPLHVITFTTTEARIELPSWNSGFDGQLQIAFKSMNASGILLKNTGITGDFLELTVNSSAVTLRFNLGQGGSNSETLTVKSGFGGFDDDRWHRIRLSFSTSRVSLRVDDLTESFKTFGQSHQVARLDIDAPLFIGSDPKAPQRGFIGCVGDLYIGEVIQHLDSYADAFSGVRKECGTACSFRPCEHNTTCTGTYGSFKCDCLNTPWTGPKCESPKGAAFQGGNFIEYKTNQQLPNLPNGRDDISFTFVTAATNVKILNIETSNNQKLDFELKNGQGLLTINNVQTSMQAFLGDDQRHHVIITPSRRSVTIDGAGQSIQGASTVTFNNAPKVQFGNSINPLSTTLCVSNVSYIGIPVIVMAFRSPRNTSITMKENAQQRYPMEDACVNGFVIRTMAPIYTFRTLESTTVPNGGQPTNAALTGISSGGIVAIIVVVVIVLLVAIILIIKYRESLTGQYKADEDQYDEGTIRPPDKHNVDGNTELPKERQEWLI